MLSIALALEPTSRAVSIGTDDPRIERYLRSVYAPLVATDGLPDGADDAVLQTGCGPARATFRGATLPAPDPRDPTCPWNSGSYVADQFVWQTLARDDEWLAVHASALAIDGRGVLLVGPGGCGKTTLSLALAAQGAHLFGDEMALLHRGERTVSAIPRLIGIRTQSLEVLADDDLATAVRRNAARVCASDAVHYVAASQLFAQPVFLAARPLRAVFLVGARAAQPAVRATARAAAAMRVAPFLSGSRRGLAAVAELAELFAEASAFTLQPADPRATARLVRETAAGC